MMKSISSLSLALTLFFIFASCSKDSADKQDLSPKGLLTSHGWRISSVVAFGDIPNYDPNLKDCNSDDCLFFKPDGTFIFKFGSNKCNPNETDETGTWSLSADGKSFDSFYGTTYYSIFSIEKTSLILVWEYNGWGWKYTYISC